MYSLIYKKKAMYSHSSKLGTQTFTQAQNKRKPTYNKSNCDGQKNEE